MLVNLVTQNLFYLKNEQLVSSWHSSYPSKPSSHYFKCWWTLHKNSFFLKMNNWWVPDIPPTPLNHPVTILIVGELSYTKSFSLKKVGASGMYDDILSLWTIKPSLLLCVWILFYQIAWSSWTVLVSCQFNVVDMFPLMCCSLASTNCFIYRSTVVDCIIWWNCTLALLEIRLRLNSILTVRSHSPQGH